MFTEYIIATRLQNIFYMFSLFCKLIGSFIVGCFDPNE